MPTVPAAAWCLIIGLSLMFTLAPATRFGYYIYPGALLLWLQVSLLSRRWSGLQPVQAADGPVLSRAGQPSPDPERAVLSEAQGLV